MATTDSYVSRLDGATDAADQFDSLEATMDQSPDVPSTIAVPTSFSTPFPQSYVPQGNIPVSNDRLSSTAAAATSSASASLPANAAIALDLQAKGTTFGNGGDETTAMTLGNTGSGITVGILSDSFNTSGNADTMATDIAGGYLPANTDDVKDSANGTDEGRAMAQIVHEIAPGASIEFETANKNQQDFADNILDLASKGCKIIVDDFLYYAEPDYQDGVVAQAIEKVEAQGVVYLAAAQNDASQGYEGAFSAGRTFTYGGQTFTADDFSTGGTALSNSLLSIDTTYGAVVSLQWESQAASAGGPGATSDLAIFVVDANGNVVTSIGADNAVGDDAVLGKDPFQEVFIPNGGTTYYLEVGLLSGSAAPADLKITAFDDDGGVTLGTVASNTNVGTMSGHAGAPGVIAVGAVNADQTPAYGNTPPVNEPYSSAGPVDVTYSDDGTTLATPRVAGVAATGADGDITSFFGDQGTDTQGNSGYFFTGTSAAAPSLAGVAALMLQENGALTPGDVKNVLQDAASGQPTVDGSGAADPNVGGAGLVDGHLAIQFSQLSNNTLTIDTTGTVLGTHFDDRLTGDAGANTLTGGAGSDTFVFTAHNFSAAQTGGASTVTDYDQGDSGSFAASESDLIDASAIVQSAYDGGTPADSLVRVDTEAGGPLDLQIYENGTWTTQAVLGGLTLSDGVSVMLDPSAPVDLALFHAGMVSASDLDTALGDVSAATQGGLRYDLEVETAGLSSAQTLALGAGNAVAVQVDTGATTLSGDLTGAGSLAVSGIGTLDLTNANNAYTGGTSLASGTLELAAANAAGATQVGSQTAGGVAYAGGTATLRIDKAAFIESGTTGTYAAPVTGFAAGDVLDLSDLAYAAGTSVTDTADTLTVTSAGGTRTLTDFALANPVPAGDALAVTQDATGGTEVTIAHVPTVMGSGQATTDNEGSVPPFANATVTDTNAGATDTVTIALTGAGGAFAEPASGGGTLTGDDTSYTLTAAAGTITTALRALQFTSNAGTAATPAITNFTLADVSSDGPSSRSDSAFSVTDFDTPGRPPAPILAASSDSGLSDSDDVTNVQEPTFTGAAGAVVPNSTVTLYQGKAEIGTATANADGAYSVTAMTALTQGRNNVTITQTANSLTSVMSPATTVTLDTATPTVTSDAASPATGDLDAGKTVTFTLTTSEPVYVLPGSGGATPTLTLNDGGTATYTGPTGTGTSTSAPTFSYAVAAGQNTSALAVAGVQLNGSTIEDRAGNAANLSGADATFTGLQVDTTAPTIAITSPIASDNTINAAEAAQGVAISGTTTAEDGQTVTIQILNAAGTAVDSYTDATSGGAYSVEVTSAQAQALADGSYTVTADVSDKAGNPATEATQPITVAETAPTIEAIADSGPGIDANGDGDLGAGRTVTLTVTTSEAVTVQGGTPTLTLNDGATATYTGGSGTTQQTFSYTVAAGQDTAKLAVTAVNADGAAVTDAAGNPLDPGIMGAAVPSGTLAVDTTAPVASSPTDTVAQNSGPTPIGIAAPSDNLTPAGSLAIVAGALPTDGTVTLANGTTPVTAGQSLTDAQLTGLLYTPTPGVSGESSTFTYTVTDGARNATQGTAALNVGAVVAPTITGTRATADQAEAPVTPFAGVTVTDPSGAAGATETLTIALTGQGGTLIGAGLTRAADGSYQLAGTAAQVTQQLDALSFTPTSGAPGTTTSTTFVLTDRSSAGTSVADSGTSVADTVAAAPAPSPAPQPSPAPAPAPVAPDAVSFSPQVTYRDGVFSLSGTASSAVGVRSVEVTATVGGRVQDLGAATVNADGTFDFSGAAGPRVQGFITATETDNAGGTASAQANYSLTGGLGVGAYTARQTTYTQDGSAVTSRSLFEDDGSHSTRVNVSGQTFASDFFDTFNNGGVPETTFVFDPGHGLDVVNGFRKDGTDHDVLSFTGSDFGNSVAQVLQNTYQTRADGTVIGHANDPIAQALSGITKGAGVIVYDPMSMDTVKVNGITKGQLAANQADIEFHA